MGYIKWLSKNDWALGRHLKRMEEIFNEHTEEKGYTDVNSIMELFVVCKYIDVKIYPLNWNELMIDNASKTILAFKTIIGKSFGKLKENEIADVYKELHPCYKKLYWEAFSIYKVHERVKYSCIRELIKDNKNILRNILCQKKLVLVYGKEIRRDLLAIEDSAEWLLDEYDVYHETDRERLYFPIELTLDDKMQIIKDYIEWDEANPNYLKMLMHFKDNADTLIVGNKNKLHAKMRYEKEMERLFSEGTALTSEIKVEFIELDDDGPEFKMIATDICCRYDTNWIKYNMDFPTLLNNFIYLFGYVDLQWRISFVEKEIYKGITERSLIMRSKDSYEPGYATNTMNLLADMQMTGYYQQLEKNGVRLEAVIKWFFEEYLRDEFQIEGFRMNVPSVETTYLEKCRTMLTEMDGILKQYNLYVEDGYVNQELFQISSDHMWVKDCKSIVRDKYVYGTGEGFEIACYYLFSDQSDLAYVERIDKPYDSFYELLRSETIYDTDFPQYTKSIFNWLIEHGYILIEDHQIKFGNYVRVALLKQLYDNNVISYWHVSERCQAELQKMKENNLVEFESSLFAKKEYEYFDYYLNKATYNNGLDLRNKYLHGSQPNSPEDEKIHMNNYWTILKLFVLCVLKINDDVEVGERDEKDI